MSRRTRALIFMFFALAAAVLAAGIADGYGSSVARGYGPLRSVVIAARELEPGKPLLPAEVSGALESRRVPARFAPPGALEAPEDALGLVPVAPVSAGSYLLATQLRPPGRAHSAGPALGPQRHPVEIGVTGAEALLSTGAASRGQRWTWW
jgi:Flp pilus assembly protein CpaB